jgi:hypothetical protein
VADRAQLRVVQFQTFFSVSTARPFSSIYNWLTYTNALNISGADLTKQLNTRHVKDRLFVGIFYVATPTVPFMALMSYNAPGTTKSLSVLYYG